MGMTTNYVTVFNELLSIKIPRPHPLTEKDEEKIKKRFRTIRNRTIRQRAGMLGLCAVVNAYPHHVPTFVPEILVEVARIGGGSKGTLKTSLFGNFRKSKEDGWLHHKRMFTPEQYEFLQEFFGWKLLRVEQEEKREEREVREERREVREREESRERRE